MGRVVVPAHARARATRAMASSVPKEYQKSYTWDAIVFSDGATYVSTRARRMVDPQPVTHPPSRGFPAEGWVAPVSLDARLCSRERDRWTDA